MRFLPLFLDLAGRDVVLVGSSEAVENKFRLLRAAGAHVRWYAACAEGASAMEEEGATIDSRAPLETDLDDAALVISAAGDSLDREVSCWARARRIPINVVDRPDLSTFITPAIVDRGDVVVAVGTGGASPVLARRIREQIEALLPARVGDLAALLGRWRPRAIAALQSFAAKRRFWERAVDGRIAAAALAGNLAEAEALLAEALARPEVFEAGGSVAIVGAGPGDPDLLTLKALRAISDADIIFYDDLVTEGVLDRVRRDAERVFVGKRRGRPGIGQEAINRLLVETARAGKRVVRLKGGDPFIFGRGGEELEALRAEGIPVTVIPGISSALGCAAEAELPLTLRDVATKLTLLSGHRVNDGDVDWSGLDDPTTTIVVYMGLAAAAKVRDGLIAAGRDPATPAAILARGTRNDAKSVAGRLDALPALAAQIGEGPALIVIGEVVRLSAPWRAASNTKEAVA